MSETSTILDALVEIAPEEITRVSRYPDKCILATNIGCKVLEYFGVLCTPCSVEMSIFNPLWVEWSKGKCQGDPVALGCWSIQFQEGAPPTPHKWNGHLVIAVHSEQVLVDLDLGQFNRPHKKITLPQAIVFDCSDPPPWGYTINECVVTLCPRKGDVSWKQSPDWRAAPREAIGAIIRKMNAQLPKGGDLVTFDIVDRPQETPVVEVRWTEQALDDLRKAYHQGQRAIRIPYRERAYPVVHHQLLIAFSESPLSDHFRLRTKAQSAAFYAWLELRKAREEG